jgi:hypothetical protein
MLVAVCARAYNESVMRVLGRQWLGGDDKRIPLAMV